jgi:hypothetical protein
MEYGNCATQSTHKIITAEENKRKLTINNPSGKLIKKVKVDGCLEVGTGKRCDYLFEIEEPISHVIYLELKGNNVERAYQQLIATIELFVNEHQGTKKECHIVASRVPKAGTKVQDLKVELLKKKKATLIVSTDKAFVTI